MKRSPRAATGVMLVVALFGCRGSGSPHADGVASSVQHDSGSRPDVGAQLPVPVDAAKGDAASPDAAFADAAPPAALACLADHYVGRVVETGSPSSTRWAFELPDGMTMPYDDGREKTAAERIASPDLEDMFALGYPRGAIIPVTNEEDDPGRARVEALFRAAYGDSEAQVSASLVPVKIAGKTVRFHRRAAPALERVASRIDALLRADPALDRYFRNLGGTFAARKIAGTDRTSAHAWGIAIDIDTAMADYWRNGPKRQWRNRIPSEIVSAFEAEAFVWGGRWFHYDTMHFEYRPELFDARCRTSPLRHESGSRMHQPRDG